MLGKQRKLSFAAVRDVLWQCGKKLGKALDVLIDKIFHGVPQLNQGDPKVEDYKLLRESASRHYDNMRSCFEKAASAHNSGQKSEASALSKKAKFHQKLGQEADKKASMAIFKRKNKRIKNTVTSKGSQNTVTIDLHGQHVKEAIMLLKVHLLILTTHRHAVQLFRVITGWGAHGDGKSKVKSSVIGFIKSKGIKWSEENRGTVLVKLEGRRDMNFLESEDEFELHKKLCRVKGHLKL